MNCLHKNQQIILISKLFFTSLVVRCQYFHDKKKITETKNEETCELGFCNGR